MGDSTGDGISELCYVAPGSYGYGINSHEFILFDGSTGFVLEGDCYYGSSEYELIGDITGDGLSEILISGVSDQGNGLRNYSFGSC